MTVAYAFVLTSCGRFDLLDVTLGSFAAQADIAPAQVVITEDSGDTAVFDVVRKHYPDARVLLNEPRLGQIRSIDLAYGHVETDYIFHCEDDWQFYRSDFIAQSRILLDAFADVSMIGLRPRSEHNPLMRNMPATTHAGITFHHFDPKKHPEYFSYSFNPGLRRMADYKRIGPFQNLGPEEHVSYAFKKAGFHVANLEEPVVRHIGDGRHTGQRPKNLVQRLKRSANKRILRLERWWTNT